MRDNRGAALRSSFLAIVVSVRSGPVPRVSCVSPVSARQHKPAHLHELKFASVFRAMRGLRSHPSFFCLEMASCKHRRTSFNHRQAPILTACEATSWPIHAPVTPVTSFQKKKRAKSVETRWHLSPVGYGTFLCAAWGASAWRYRQPRNRVHRASLSMISRRRSRCGLGQGGHRLRDRFSR